MAAKLEKTRTPGIYKRGSRYVFSYRVDGAQRWESCRTLDDARRAKARRKADLDSGEYVAQRNDKLADYTRQWIKNYQGRTRRGFREETREEYKRQLEQYLLKFFPAGKLLRAVTTDDMRLFVAWVCDEEEQGRRLSDATVERILAPIKALFATAYEDKVIPRNPCAVKGLLPQRDSGQVTEDDDVKAMTRDQLARFLERVDGRWVLFFEVLAVAGVRISEAIGLQWKHVQVTGSEPHIKIRRRIVRAKPGPPKSKHGRREIPISAEMAAALIEQRRITEWPQDDDPVFPSGAGHPLSPSSVFGRVLKPAADAADVSWIGFHTFRHTCASMLIAEGRNIVQVSRFLGHHSPAFTLTTYAHLMDEGVGGPVALNLKSANTVQTDPTPLGTIRPQGMAA